MQNALMTAGDDFLDMARYLIIGSLLAAAMQTLIPQSALLAIGQGSGALRLGNAGAGVCALSLFHGRCLSGPGL
ncbi:MAG: hypothetical protein R3E79_44755 [Caldilineaceae bacterium]